MKTALRIDELKVETFVTGNAAYGSATVDGLETLPTAPLCSRYCPSGLCNTATCTLEVCC